MKKNKMMRIASVLLIAALLSTSVISGTFAKYVTQTSAGDSARVAKWGVTVGTSGALFSETYVKHSGESGASSIANTVVSSEKVVAPGTSYEDVAPGTGLTFTVSGVPEVAVKISFDVNDDYKDVVMPAANGYTDFTVVPNGTFNLTEDYHPLVFTLKDRSGTVVDCGGNTLKDIVDYLEGNPIFVGPGVDLSTAFGSYTLTWAWDYAGNDQADTFLGQYAFNNATSLPSTPPEAAGKFSHEVSLEVTITVTQVD